MHCDRFRRQRSKPTFPTGSDIIITSFIDCYSNGRWYINFNNYDFDHNVTFEGHSILLIIDKRLQ